MADMYPGEIAFAAGRPVFWNDVTNTKANPNYIPLNRPDFTDPQYNRVVHESWHMLGHFSLIGGSATLMELPPEQYWAEPLRQYRRELYTGLGVDATTLLRDDVSGLLPEDPPVDIRGTIVHKGVLGDLPVVTITRTIASEGQELRQLSIHEATPAATLNELIVTIGGLGLGTIMTNPPGTIAATLRAINAYSATEASQIRNYFSTSTIPPEIANGVLQFANRWTVPDRNGLWLAMMFVRNGYRIPDNIHPTLESYAKRLRRLPMSASQDTLLHTFVTPPTEGVESA